MLDIKSMTEFEFVNWWKNHRGAVYDGGTGEFKDKKGKRCDYLANAGYRVISKTVGSVKRGQSARQQRRVYAHRAAYIISTGQPIPDGAEVDHLNRNRSDNRMSNLQLTTHSGNGVWRLRARNQE